MTIHALVQTKGLSLSISNWLSDLPPNSLRLLQITDTHIYGSNDQALLGVDTLDSLKDTLQTAMDSYWPVDAILLTGDIVHDASDSGYQKVQNLLKSIQTPVLCLPGNHDTNTLFNHYLNHNNISIESFHKFNGWNICMLDSSVDDEEYGYISSQNLNALSQQLTESPNTPTLVCLHHQPIDIDSGWIDQIGLHNKNKLWDIIHKHPQVKGVLWGHIHQEYDKQVDGIKLMATPSTCVQFLPHSDGFAVDEIPAGCRWIALTPDGTIETRVQRMNDVSASLKTQSMGY